MNLCAVLWANKVVKQRHHHDLFSDLSEIDTQRLVLLARSEVAARDAVDGEQQDERNHKRPTETGSRVGKLITKLNPVLVDPTTRDRSGTVKRRNAVVGKDTSKQVAHNTTNTVSSKDVESIIVTEKVLETSGKVASRTTEHAKGNSCGRSDVTRSWRDSDQTRDGTRAETDSRPLALQPPVPEHPGETTDRGSHLSDHHGLNSTKVGTKSRTTVEAEPAKPQQHGSQDDVGNVVGSVGQLLRAVPLTLAEEDRDGERSGTRRDVNRCTTGEVETTHDVGPTLADVPCPIGDGIVDNSAPAEGENENGTQSSTVGKRTAGNHRGDGGEHHLVDAEEQLWKPGPSCRRPNVDVDQTKVVKVLFKKEQDIWHHKHVSDGSSNILLQYQTKMAALTPMNLLLELVEKAREKPQKNHSKDATDKITMDIQIIESADFFLSRPA